MKKLIHKEKFTITGRGQVYTINLKENGIPGGVLRENGIVEGIDRKEIPNYIPMNSIWEIDGKIWIVRGIETFATYIIRDVGLLVRELNEEEIKQIAE